MAIRFRRRGGRRRPKPLLGPRTGPAVHALQSAHKEYVLVHRRFDLRAIVTELFTREPTRDVRELKARGVEPEPFYDEELAPNWDDLDRGKRAAKVEAFARLANALEASDEDLAGMGALVRTKLLILAWAHDETYGEGYLRRIEEEPERFGGFEPAR
jgi:hypothetical protein